MPLQSNRTPIPENYLSTFVKNNITHQFDMRYSNVVIQNEDLINPFFSSKPIGWCSCSQYFNPNLFRIENSNDQLMVVCSDCLGLIVYSHIQIISLVLMVSIKNLNKISRLQKWRRSCETSTRAQRQTISAVNYLNALAPAPFRWARRRNRLHHRNISINTNAPPSTHREDMGYETRPTVSYTETSRDISQW